MATGMQHAQNIGEGRLGGFRVMRGAKQTDILITIFRTRPGGEIMNLPSSSADMKR